MFRATVSMKMCSFLVSKTFFGSESDILEDFVFFRYLYAKLAMT